MFCRVIVDIVHENVAHTYTYMIPDGMNIQPGHRVLVPFGKRETEGIVLGLSETADIPESKLKSVIRTLEDYPAILPQLLDLAAEMAEQNHCPQAETLRLMLPAEMRGGRIHTRTIDVARLKVTPDEALKAASAEKRSPKRRKLLEILADGADHAVRDLGVEVRDPSAALKKLAEDGLILLEKRESLRMPCNLFHSAEEKAPELTPGQQEALSEILPALRGKPGRFLLHGVTGSGKTEVFMSAVRQTLDLGKTAVILVPEIALTPQMVDWFRTRFGSAAAVLHSRLSPGERYDEWRRIRRGDAQVVIGARSAVFAPLDKLGLIVIDEEHETTYMNDHHPRYDARDVALSRCKREGATMILASATPSILSFARARRGDMMLLEMPNRVHDRPLPQVEIVDMRQELENGNRTVLSGTLRQALKECIARGEQAMLLMNRRGYNSFVSCRSCGYVVRCVNCDVSMTYHVGGTDNKLVCHYCGQVCTPPSVCPKCGSSYIRYFGAGTQKVEDEVSKLMPDVAISRMDTDTTSGKEGHGRILDDFRSGRTRVLIGTQMIAKGLDFPRVTLVGVVSADMTLNLPDFRSRERTFQLLTQVAGRAGRGTAPGRVIIQTYKPDDTVILQAAAQDYRSFFETEFQRRRNSLYPPFTVMVRLLVESGSADLAGRVADELYDTVKALTDGNPEWKKRVLLLNTDRAPIHLLRGKERTQVLLKLLVHPETEKLCARLSELAREERNGADVYYEYNPTAMI